MLIDISHVNSVSAGRAAHSLYTLIWPYCRLGFVSYSPKEFYSVRWCTGLAGAVGYCPNRTLRSSFCLRRLAALSSSTYS